MNRLQSMSHHHHLACLQVDPPPLPSQESQLLVNDLLISNLSSILHDCIIPDKQILEHLWGYPFEGLADSAKGICGRFRCISFLREIRIHNPDLVPTVHGSPKTLRSYVKLTHPAVPPEGSGNTCPRQRKRVLIRLFQPVIHFHCNSEFVCWSLCQIPGRNE